MSRNAPIEKDSTETYVTFTLGNERFCATVKRVREIVRTSTYTRLPGAAQGILGVINVRGKMLPVVDPSLPLLGVYKDDPGHGRILIFSAPHGDVGLLVDDVLGVTQIPGTDVSPPSDILNHHPAVIGMIALDGGNLTLVDLHRLVDAAAGNREREPALAS